MSAIKIMACRRRRSRLGQLLHRSTIVFAAIIGFASVCSANFQPDNSTVTNSTSKSDEIHVSGWTQINERWPLDAYYYFYAATKGHHQLEIKLPEELARLSVNVSMIFYFNHTEIRPTLQVVSCGNSYDDLAISAYWQRGWYNQAIILKGHECPERKRLTLNILLHDVGDVFAVSYLEVSDARPDLDGSMGPNALMTYLSSWDDGSAQFKAMESEILDLASKLSGVRSGILDLDGSSSTWQTKLDELLAKILSQRVTFRCWPVQCDRNMFVFTGLMGIIRGVSGLDRATLADSRHRFYLNTRNEPLRLLIADGSSEHDFAKEDVCFEFRLFMDTGANISLSIGDKNLTEWGKLLEVFDRPADHWAAGGWETINRCMSNYLPRLTPISTAESRPINQLALRLKAHSGVAYELERIIVEFVAGRSESFREAPKVLSCLQDVSDVGDARQIEKIWTPSGGLVHEAKFTLLVPSDAHTNSSGRPLLGVSDIEPVQRHLDLTSAWIKPNGSRPTTITLEYQFDRPNWLEAVDFEFQAADPRIAATRWQSERIYAAKNGSQQQPYGIEAISHNSKAVVNDEEFRVRLRHHINGSQEIRGQVNSHNLTIRALSLGDACALNRSHCLNGSKCQPIGIMQLECECLPGYSGPRCENMKPCEVHYASGLPGFEYCNSVGASCDPNIPVFRCVWPSDNYYQCTKVVSAPALEAAQREESAEQGRVRLLQASERKQRQIIIEMAIVMVGIVLAALASGIYLKARLAAANERLMGAASASARSEAHELMGRSSCGLTNGGASVGSRSVDRLTHNCV